MKGARAHARSYTSRRDSEIKLTAYTERRPTGTAVLTVALLFQTNTTFHRLPVLSRLQCSTI